METHSGRSQNLDDLIFENRNKEYGAYAIRRSYSDNVNKALIYALCSATIIIVLPSVISSFWTTSIKQIVEVIPGVIVPEHPPIIIPDEIPKTFHPPVKSISQKLTYEVTKKEVTDIEPPKTPSSENIDDVDVGHDLVDVETLTTSSSTETPKVITCGPFIIVEEMPEYKDLARYLQRTLRYPAAAMRTGTQGTVYVSFVINTNGEVILPDVMRGISKECDAEALRVIAQMPAWTPGRQHHQAVMVRMVLPIKFQLQ